MWQEAAWLILDIKVNLYWVVTCLADAVNFFGHLLSKASVDEISRGDLIIDLHLPCCWAYSLTQSV